MANIISDETIEYVGILAKLELSDEEKETAKKDMGRMLDYIDKLNELDTSGVEPMSHVFPMNNVFREDVVTNGDERDKILLDRKRKLWRIRMDSGKAVENSKHDRHEWRKQREYPGFNSGSAWKKDQGRRDHGRGSHKGSSGPDQDSGAGFKLLRDRR